MCCRRYLSKTGRSASILSVLAGVIVVLAFASLTGWAQAVDDCMLCHENTELTKETDGREVSLFVDPARFTGSVHGDMECIDCHSDLDGFEDFPHEEELERVDCSLCHDDIADIYSSSLHGKAALAGAKLAPQCADCHGSHYILDTSSPESIVTKFNIPFLCGRCHKEGTEVTRTYDIAILATDLPTFELIGKLYELGLSQK